MQEWFPITIRIKLVSIYNQVLSGWTLSTALIIWDWCHRARIQKAMSLLSWIQWWTKKGGQWVWLALVGSVHEGLPSALLMLVHHHHVACPMVDVVVFMRILHACQFCAQWSAITRLILSQIKLNHPKPSMRWSARRAVPVSQQKGQTSLEGSTVVHGWINTCNMAKELKTARADNACEWWLVSTSADLFVADADPRWNL